MDWQTAFLFYALVGAGISLLCSKAIEKGLWESHRARKAITFFGQMILLVIFIVAWPYIIVQGVRYAKLEYQRKH